MLSGVGTSYVQFTTIMNPEPIPFSLVIPCYNEVDRLPKTLERLSQWNPDYVRDLEIILVNDGSADATADVIRQYAGRDPRLRLVDEPHVGAMHALIAGYKTATNPYIGNMEADCATDPSEFQRLIPYLGTFDVVTGSRQIRGPLPAIEGKSFSRRILSWGMSRLFFSLFSCGIRDPQIGFKIFKANVLQDALPLLTSQHDGIKCAELIVKAHGLGYRVKEVPVLYTHDDNSRLVPKRPYLVVYNVFKATFRMWLDTIHQYNRGIFSQLPIRGRWLTTLLRERTAT